MHRFTRDDLTFDVNDRGPSAGEAVVLLHGWPSGNDCWDEVGPGLARAGLRTLAPDQRGYSPRARPSGRRPYRMSELVADVIALLDAADLDRAHIVGHDWGGAVTWALAAWHPDRVASATVLSTPHPHAIQRSMVGIQALRSAYIGFFQVPLLPEKLLTTRDALVGRRVLERSGLSPERAAQYLGRQSEPGAMSASLAWYRALLADPRAVQSVGPVTVPTTFAWSTGDTALGRKAAELTADDVTGPYRFEVLDGVSHWVPEEVPDVVVDLVAAQVAAAS